MSQSDFTQILQQAQQVQGRLAELQQKLATQRYEGSAGGGMVKAICTGELCVVEVNIEASLVSGGDREMIQDLCAAAVNAALANAQQGARDQMQQVTGGLGLPNLGSLTFPTAGGAPGAGGTLPGTGGT